MAERLEFNIEHGSHEDHVQLLEQRIVHLEADIESAREKGISTEQLEAQLDELTGNLEAMKEQNSEREAV